MSARPQTLLIGGVIPAVLLGCSNLFQKLATGHGIGPGPFLVAAGLTTAVVGGVFTWLDGDWAAKTPGLLWTAAFGVAWACATGCVALALKKLGAQVSQLVPIYNMNTLIAVALGLIVLGEWRTVSAWRVVCAATLIIAGGVLASRA